MAEQLPDAPSVRWHVVPSTPHLPAYICTDPSNRMHTEIAVVYGEDADQKAQRIVDAVNNSSAPSEIAPTRDAVLVPLKLLEQCEVWIGTAAHVGITTHYPDGTETENRLALLKAADELRALLYRASQERHSERNGT